MNQPEKINYVEFPSRNFTEPSGNEFAVWSDKEPLG
jgi:hypothetical protein